jgi:hypothetical protein
MTADPSAVEAGTVSLGGVRYTPPESKEGYAIWLELMQSVRDAKELSMLAQALV